MALLGQAHHDQQQTCGRVALELLGEGELERIRVHDLNEDEEYELTADVFVVLE